MSGSWPTPTDWSCRGSPRRPRAVSRPQWSLAKPTCRPVQTTLRWSASCQWWRARGSRRQQPCCGDHGHHLLCTREAYKRECLSPLYEEATSERSMPTPETPEVVNVNCSIFSNAGGGWNRGFSHTGLSRGQNLSSSGSMCAFLSCLFIAVGG